MKCVCVRTCQIIHNDQPRRIRVGQVLDLEKCLEHFEPIESRALDFATASEQELLESTWKVSEAKSEIKRLFNYDLKSGTKQEMVKAILDARYRKVD